MKNKSLKARKNANKAGIRYHVPSLLSLEIQAKNAPIIGPITKPMEKAIPTSACKKQKKKKKHYLSK